MHIIILCLALSCGSLFAETWAERTLRQMSQEEKIGQLLMVAAYVDADYAQREIGNPHIIQDVEKYITLYHVGGLAYVGPSDVVQQVALTNRYQEISKYPILIAQDLEWGLSMRLKDTMNFPKNSTLGAVTDEQLIYQMGQEIGRQARLLGIHMNLSPVLDVNINRDNPVINVRSFGSSPQMVAEMGIAMIRGLQDAGVIASAKHFPGLGDITVDPHLDLPHSPHGTKRLETVELYPFSQAIRAGVLSIQTEHLMVPALDEKYPASLSKTLVTGVLKEKLGFTGLILSGALRMKALTNHFSDEEIILQALLAGSDMLLMPADVPKAYQTLKTAVDTGIIDKEALDEHVLKILQMKERVHLDTARYVSVPTREELYTPSAQTLKRELYQNAVTIMRDARQALPHRFSEQDRIAFVQLGDAPSAEFFDKISHQRSVARFIFPLDQDHTAEEQRLLQEMSNYSLIILAVYPADPRRIAEIRLLNEKRQKEELTHFRIHGIPEPLSQLVGKLQPYEQKSVVVFFGNPFGSHFFDHYSTFIMAFETDPEAQQAAAQLLIGR